jgi:tRNA 2-thiouridine synthesizing protein A
VGSERDGEPVEDARGLLCPLPVIKLAARIRSLAPGDALVLLADDPSAEEDVRLWCRGQGHEFVESEPAGGHVRMRVRRGR